MLYLHKNPQALYVWYRLYKENKEKLIRNK